MFSFIPTYEYTHYFNLFILFLVLLAFYQCSRAIIFTQSNERLNAAWGCFVAVAIILYIGYRNPTGPFGDTVNYTQSFWRAAASTAPFKWTWKGEWLFYNVMMRGISHYADVTTFYLVCAAIYVGCLWVAMVRMFGRQYYIPFLVILSMFFFWQYGVNGIRNGLGASLFILALTYVEKLPIALLLCFLATGMHKSTYIMIGAAGLAWFVKNSYIYLTAWILSVIASYFAGFGIQYWIARLNLTSGDDRLSDYLTQTDAAEILRKEGATVVIGFRWDFLIFSSMAVLVGYYFIFRRKFQDEYYHWIYNIYLITNAFWVLVIRASYSNRFAQISWFIMPIVLIYPFMKQRFWTNHERMTGFALLLFYAFAFYTNILRG
jgi:hypothetical protein